MKIRAFIFYFLFFGIVFLHSCARDSQKHSSSQNNIDAEKYFFELPNLPSSVTFCNAPISLLEFDIIERLDRELIINTFYHSSTIQLFKRAKRFLPYIEKTLKSEGIPDDFKYLCMIESNFTQATSPSGAVGFWQLMPQTATDAGLLISNEVDERYHIEKSTLAACDYLKKAYAKFNDWTLAAASYNRGIAGIENVLIAQDVTSYFDLFLNDETSRYVFRILAIKLIFEDPEKYGFKTNSFTLYEPLECREIEVKNSISNLIQWAKQNGSNYKMLRLYNPWILSNHLTVSNNSYVIKLPKIVP